jgi:hypothetical protein
MKKKLFLSILVCASCSPCLMAQSVLPEFGAYSTEELAMTESALDKEAEAVILLDEAHAHYNDNYELITDRRIRIKILNQRGLDRGSIAIPFYSKGGFEKIIKLEAMTFNKGDDKPVSKVAKNGFYTEKVDDRYSRIKFAMPNVKPGSIIEYKYTSIMEHYGGLDDWLFQSDIPTLKSCYKLEILPNCEFSYVLNKKKFLDLTIVPPKDNGIIYFEMKNVPGLRFEPYMDAVKDYMQRVEFKFSGCRNRLGEMERTNETWKSVAEELWKHESLGGTSDTRLPEPMDLSAAVITATTDLNKVIAIYNYVKNNFTWNGYNGKYAPDGLKKIWEAKTGSAGELNLVLINLLQSFKFDAKPLLVAERDFGKVDPRHVYVDRFNKTVAFLDLNGEKLIMDATNKYSLATLIPYPILNTYGLLIDKKTDGLVEIANPDEKYKEQVTITGSLGKDGSFKGRGVISSSAYARESKSSAIANKTKFIKEKIEDLQPGSKVDSFYYDEPADESAPLTQRFQYSNQLDESGGFVFWNYNSLTGLTKNPFTAEHRFTNVNFGYPFDIEINETIELPPGSKTDDLLKEATLEHGSQIFLWRTVKRTGNTVKIRIVFKQRVAVFTADEYPALKNFYKSMVEMLAEPVVIKLGQ